MEPGENFAIFAQKFIIEYIKLVMMQSLNTKVRMKVNFNKNLLILVYVLAFIKYGLKEGY